MPRPTPPRRRRLGNVRDMLKGRAYGVLAAIRTKVPRVLRVVARNKTQTVMIVISPAGTEADEGPRPGRWLSSCEQLIVDRVREVKRSTPHEKMTQGTIAARAALPLDPAFKAIVRNLVDRQILTHDDNSGYDLAPGV